MRGWRVRTLGPGSYIDTTGNQSGDNSTAFIDRTGDIKLELNAEYRFNIFQLFGDVLGFKGAVFADAGNMWLANKSSSYPNGEFDFSRLYTDIALNSGLGLRIDIASLFVLRLDWAMPMKTPGNLVMPSKGIKQGWIVEDIAFGNNDWRKKNIIWNVAVNYPF
jgi:outer membrane protein insertion porin family